MLHFNKRYLLVASGLLITKVLIALYVHDRIIRPYAGDLLATIFLYCLLRSFVVMPPKHAAAVALLISYLIEGLQLINLLSALGWQHSRLARIALGSHFAWGDVLAYTLGALVVLATEHQSRRNGTFQRA